MDHWIGEAVAKMHINRISQMDIANHLGVTNDYISMILNGKRSPKDGQQRILKALDEIIAERVSKKTDN